jgi:hypothetical protein
VIGVYVLCLVCYLVVGIAKFGGRIFTLFVAPLGKLSANDFDVFVLSLSLSFCQERESSAIESIHGSTRGGSTRVVLNEDNSHHDVGNY